MKILITGGTGTVGQEIVRQLYKKAELIVFSRNEFLQVEMSRKFPKVEYIIGNIRDYRSLKEATKKDVYMIYHLAAIKHISICHKQPEEAIRTNVFGTINVMKAAKRNGCDVVFLSTDKAENPTCVYGNTKAIAEQIALDGGSSVVRSGNIFGSSGSVIPLFINQVKTKNELTLTDGNMTRYFISVKELVYFMIFIAAERPGLHFPGIRSFTMGDVARMCIKRYGNADTKIIETGPRIGEKKHELFCGISSEHTNDIKYLEELFDEYERRDG